MSQLHDILGINYVFWLISDQSDSMKNSVLTLLTKKTSKIFF